MRTLAAIALLFAPPALAEDPNQCTTATPHTRPASKGMWTHWVTVTNDCKQKVYCTLTTDVNDDQHAVELESKESKDVPTYMLSPASQFAAKLKCNFGK